MALLGGLPSAFGAGQDGETKRVSKTALVERMNKGENSTDAKKAANELVRSLDSIYMKEKLENIQHMWDFMDWHFSSARAENWEDANYEKRRRVLIVTARDKDTKISDSFRLQISTRYRETEDPRSYPEIGFSYLAAGASLGGSFAVGIAAYCRDSVAEMWEKLKSS